MDGDEHGMTEEEKKRTLEQIRYLEEQIRIKKARSLQRRTLSRGVSSNPTPKNKTNPKVHSVKKTADVVPTSLQSEGKGKEQWAQKPNSQPLRVSHSDRSQKSNVLLQSPLDLHMGSDAFEQLPDTNLHNPGFLKKADVMPNLSDSKQLQQRLVSSNQTLQHKTISKVPTEEKAAEVVQSSSQSGTEGIEQSSLKSTSQPLQVSNLDPSQKFNALLQGPPDRSGGANAFKQLPNGSLPNPNFPKEADMIPNSPDSKQQHQTWRQKRKKPRSSMGSKNGWAKKSQSRNNSESFQKEPGEAKVRLFPTLKESTVSRIKDEDFSLPREYRGLKLEVQRSQNVIAPFYSPAKPSQDDFICSPSLLQTSRRRRKRGQSSPPTQTPEAKKPLFEDTLLDDLTSEQLFTSWDTDTQVQKQTEIEQKSCDVAENIKERDIVTQSFPNQQFQPSQKITSRIHESDELKNKLIGNVSTKKMNSTLPKDAGKESVICEDDNDALTQVNSAEEPKTGDFSASDSLKSVADLLDRTESLYDKKCDTTIIDKSDLVKVLARSDQEARIFPLEYHEELFVVCSKDGVIVCNVQKDLLKLKTEWSENVLVLSHQSGIQVLIFDTVGAKEISNTIRVESHACAIKEGAPATHKSTGPLILHKSKSNLTGLRVAGDHSHLVVAFSEGNSVKILTFGVLSTVPFTVKRRMGKVLIPDHPHETTLSVHRIFFTSNFLIKSANQSTIVDCQERKIYSFRHFNVPFSHLSATDEGLIILSSNCNSVRKFRLLFSSSDLEEVTQYEFNCDFQGLNVCGKRIYVRNCDGLFTLSSKMVQETLI